MFIHTYVSEGEKNKSSEKKNQVRVNNFTEIIPKKQFFLTKVSLEVYHNCRVYG